MSDVFSTESNSVELIVNGESRGSFPATGTIGDFVRSHASRAGLKSFSVYVNGTKFFTEQANQALTSGSRVELVAKDSRGVMIVNGDPTPTPAEVMAPTPSTSEGDGDPGDEQPHN